MRNAAALPPGFFGRLSRSERRLLETQLAGNWRLRLGHALESHLAHAAALCLVFVDVCAVLCEVMLTAVCPLAGGDSEGPAIWVKALGWVSKSVLLVLLAQQLVLFGCFGFAYLRKLPYVVDLAVCCVAVGLEFGALAREAHGKEEGNSAASSLVIVLLTWRVVRIVHGFAVTAQDELDDKELRVAQVRIAQLEAQLRELQGGGTAESSKELRGAKQAAPSAVAR